MLNVWDHDSILLLLKNNRFTLPLITVTVLEETYKGTQRNNKNSGKFGITLANTDSQFFQRPYDVSTLAVCKSKLSI